MNDNKVYIDVEEGAARVGGNMALYVKLLGKLVNGNYLEELDGFLATGDSEDAIRSAHSIKGVAANLSLNELSAAAAKVEATLKDGGDYAADVAQLKEVFAITKGKIAEL